MPDEIKLPENSGPKPSKFRDYFLGGLAFIVVAVLSRSFLVTALFFSFVILIVISIKFKRPGLVLGFVGAILISGVALFVLLFSFCGGMFR